MRSLTGLTSTLVWSNLNGHSVLRLERVFLGSIIVAYVFVVLSTVLCTHLVVTVLERFHPKEHPFQVGPLHRRLRYKKTGTSVVSNASSIWKYYSTSNLTYQKLLSHHQGLLDAIMCILHHLPVLLASHNIIKGKERRRRKLKIM